MQTIQRMEKAQLVGYVPEGEKVEFQELARREDLTVSAALRRAVRLWIAVTQQEGR
jgi:hypothetical protein